MAALISCRFGTVRDDWNGDWQTFCRAGRPTERGLGERAELSHLPVIAPGEMTGEFLFHPLIPPVSADHTLPRLLRAMYWTRLSAGSHLEYKNSGTTHLTICQVVRSSKWILI